MPKKQLKNTCGIKTGQNLVEVSKKIQEISYEDFITWNELSKTCKPLRDRKVFMLENKEEKPPLKKKTIQTKIIEKTIEKKEITNNNEFQTDRRTLKKIKKGKVFIDAKLDLHGMTQAEAFVALRSFIQSMSSAGKKYTIIITGKGSGILQTALPRWLELSEIKSYISWFETADIKHGGNGAFYVVLRKLK